MLDELLDRFRRKDRRALARLLSLLARGDDQMLTRLAVSAKPARVVALTGSAGVGKSTLAGKLIEHLRKQNLTVAVLACDPQSPLSGGALLGDRFRMPNQPDDGVFIRSLAAEPGQGAVARHLDGMIRLLEAFGFDVIVIETAGAGQADTAVHELADIVVLLLQPETGDELQWEKAGVLEVADIIAIQKADLSGAEHVEAQVRLMLGLSSRPPVPVLRVSAKTGEGIDALWLAVGQCPLRRSASHDEGDLLRLTQQRLAQWFQEAEARHDPSLQQVLTQWREGKKHDAAATLLKLAGDGDNHG